MFLIPESVVKHPVATGLVNNAALSVSHHPTTEQSAKT